MKKICALICAAFLMTSVFSQEKESESEDKENQGFVFSVVDFFVNGPYYVNIGCEPTTNKGATLFGSIEYKWTKDFSSQVYFEKGNDQLLTETDGEKNYDRIVITDSMNYFMKIFPYKKYFYSDEEKKVFSLSFGLAWQFTDFNLRTNELLPNSIYAAKEKDPVKIDDKYFAVYQSKGKQKNLIVGPCVDFTYDLPLFEWLDFRAEHSVVPFYYANSTFEHRYEYLNVIEGPSQSVSYSGFGTGIFQLKYHLDFFKLVGLVGNYELTRFTSNAISYDSKNELIGEKYTVIKNSLRFGIALLEATNTYVRIQSGFYREYKWTNYSNSTANDFTKDWVLSVSVGF